MISYASIFFAEVMTHVYLLAKGVPDIENRLVWVPGDYHVPWGSHSRLDMSALPGRCPTCVFEKFPFFVKQSTDFLLAVWILLKYLSGFSDLVLASLPVMVPSKLTTCRPRQFLGTFCRAMCFSHFDKELQVHPCGLWS